MASLATRYLFVAFFEVTAEIKIIGGFTHDPYGKTKGKFLLNRFFQILTSITHQFQNRCLNFFDWTSAVILFFRLGHHTSGFGPIMEEEPSEFC